MNIIVCTISSLPESAQVIRETPFEKIVSRSRAAASDYKKRLKLDIAIEKGIRINPRIYFESVKKNGSIVLNYRIGPGEMYVKVTVSEQYVTVTCENEKTIIQVTPETGEVIHRKTLRTKK